jgi:predicted dehydrogenase
VELAGLYDPDEALAQQTASKFATKHLSLGEILSDASVGLVIIEGDNTQCADFAVQCAGARKAMLLEKPGAQNEKRLREVADAVRSSGSFCQVGYHLRYSPSVQEAQVILGSGKIGRTTTVRFHAAVMQPWLTDRWFTDSRDMGGLVFLDFCHVLDLLRMFLGDLTAHRALIRKLERVENHPFEDSAAFALEYGDVLAAGDCCGWESNDWIQTWNLEFFGTEGTLIVGIHPPKTSLYRPKEGWQHTSDNDFAGELNYHRELQDVAERVKSGRAPGGCDIESAMKTVDTIKEMYDDNPA